ncbi:MAG TPA: hypothetical protein VNS08_13835, partial [Ureibacillus sp.]|nr:hypothetical protein [Ureibacillus sp.]
KLIGMEGRVQLTATPFAAERSRFKEDPQASCGNSKFICDESEAAGAPPPETFVSGRARGKRTRNGNHFSLDRKNSIFPSVEKCYFGLCPSLFVF